MTRDQAETIERMRAEGKSYGQIGRHIGKSVGAVRWYCLEYGIGSPRPVAVSKCVPGSVHRRGNGLVRRYTPQEDDRILAMRIRGATIGRIAQALGRSYSSVLGRLVTLAARPDQPAEEAE